ASGCAWSWHDLRRVRGGRCQRVRWSSPRAPPPQPPVPPAGGNARGQRDRHAPPRRRRLLRAAGLTIVGVGALGAYTTFSTFAGDALRITQERGARLATGYVVLTVALCLLAAWLGLLVG